VVFLVRHFGLESWSGSRRDDDRSLLADSGEAEDIVADMVMDVELGKLLSALEVCWSVQERSHDAHHSHSPRMTGLGACLPYWREKKERK